MADKNVFMFNGMVWMLVIDSLEDLNEYMDMVWDIRWKDLKWDIARIRKKEHPVSDMADMCYILAKTKGTNTLKEFWALRETQFKDMTKLILEGKTLYINPAGGYTTNMENIINRYESEKVKTGGKAVIRWPVFDESDIRIKQWPGGTHYYAYIGPVQVKDGGKLKWDSESEARSAAMSYVTKKSRQTLR